MTVFEEILHLWQSFDDTEKKRSMLLSFIKKHRQENLNEMRLLLEKERHGLPAMYFFSDKTDILITALFRLVFQKIYPLKKGQSLPAIVACGGYGRQELAPYSDLDILFLVNKQPDEQETERLLFIVYLLWDAGIKTGYAVRTINDCIDESLKDATVCTNLLESRYVTGNEDLFFRLLNSYQNMKKTADSVVFVDAKKKERDERHQRMGQSHYMLEPNVKEGRGGLRDLHLLFWLMKYLFDVTDLRELVRQGILDSKTVDSFLKAHDFLDTVRCYLHFYNNKRGDILTLQAQKAIAPLLGYAERSGGLSTVERFMKHYYLFSRTVVVLMHYFTAIIEDNIRPSSGYEPLPEDNRFYLNNGRIAFRKDTDISPDMFLKAFWLKQKLSRPISPATLQTITARSKEIRSLRKTPLMRDLFFDILTADNAFETLHQMLDFDVLGEIIPVFKPLIGQVQFDMYHLYTTDEHTLKVFENLSSNDQLPVNVSKQSKRTLYVAALLHDIGKGSGGNHAEKGALKAVKALSDLGLSAEETETVIWLIRHHLLMSETAFRRDIFDTKTIEDFVTIVQSPERLRLLYALTKADIQAVAPHVWNGFKERLLSDLFKNALEVMQGDALRPRSLTNGQKSLLTLKENSPSDAVLFDISVDADQGVTELAVLAPDCKGLFAAVSGALSVAGVSVVGAKISTLADGTALDSFIIQDTNASLLEKNLTTPLTSEKKIKRIKEQIRRSLSDTDLIAKEVTEKRLSTPKGPITFSPRVLTDNNASLDYTLIEVNGTDCVGFLHAVTYAMTQLNLSISSAHIYTYGSHVVDVFYVKNADGKKLDDKTCEKVCHVLLKTMENLN